MVKFFLEVTLKAFAQQYTRDGFLPCGELLLYPHNLLRLTKSRWPTRRGGEVEVIVIEFSGLLNVKNVRSSCVLAAKISRITLFFYLLSLVRTLSASCQLSTTTGLTSQACKRPVSKKTPLVWVCGRGTEERSWLVNIDLIHHCSPCLAYCLCCHTSTQNTTCLCWRGCAEARTSSGKTLTSKLSMFDYFRSVLVFLYEIKCSSIITQESIWQSTQFSEMNKSCSTVWLQSQRAWSLIKPFKKLRCFVYSKCVQRLHQDSTYRRSLGRWRKRLDHHPWVFLAKKEMKKDSPKQGHDF